MAVALTLWVGMTSCGGKLLPMGGPGSDASPGGDDAGANGGESSGGLGGGSSSGFGGGSSSGFAGGSSSGFAGGSSSGLGGSSGGGGSSSGPTGLTCTSTANCPRGQVCCGAFTTMTTACQFGPCPSSPIGPLQLCASAAECLTRGDTCGPLPIPIPIPITICNAPSNPVTCTGCIDLNGACNMGGSDTACGVNGATCQNCSAVGGACMSGSCQAASIDAGGALACMFGPCTNRCPGPLYTRCCRNNGTCGCLSSNVTCQ